MTKNNVTKIKKSVVKVLEKIGLKDGIIDPLSIN